MVGRVYATFYPPLLKIACIFFKGEFIFRFVHFCLLFFRTCTIVPDFDCHFKRVLKLQVLLYFHPRAQAPSYIERRFGSKGALFFYTII